MNEHSRWDIHPLRLSPCTYRMIHYVSSSEKVEGDVASEDSGRMAEWVKSLPLLHRHWGSELLSLCLWGRCFVHSACCPAPVSFFKLKVKFSSSPLGGMNKKAPEVL